MSRLWQHMKALWPRWTLLPPLPFLLATIFDAYHHALRWDQPALTLFVAFLAYYNEKTKKLCVGLYPIAFVGFFYDTMRFVQNIGVSAANVHDCDLRALEARFFGWSSGGTTVTLQDWFQAHSSTALDLYCAIPYGTFIWVSIAFGTFLYVKDYAALRRYTWAFFAMNVLGFATYHLYPAAPPWYFHAHGCTVDLQAAASEGPNLAHVDSLLGFGYFHSMYARASDVFGAVPSLHAAYPLLIVLEGWRNFRPGWRAASIAFTVTMWFAAVYLDHHWVIDLIIGIAYCFIVFFAARGVRAYFAQQRRAGSSDLGRERAMG